jgi:hypothetical protein
MTDIEILEDMYPMLEFYEIYVPDPRYHGHIMGNQVFINSINTDLDKIKAAIHEIMHFEYDYGDCTNVKNIRNLRAEGWAVRESNTLYQIWFG